MSLLGTFLSTILVGAVPAPPADSPTFDVMAVKSGIELVVKKDGTPTTIRLAGIEPLKSGVATGSIDRLNQTNYLRSQVPVGSKIRLVEEGAGAQVFASKDGKWVNLAVVEQGFASASNEIPTRVFPELQKAEAEARAAKRGMWSPDFQEKAAQPAHYERAAKSRTPSRSRSQRSIVAMPPGGGMPALGLGETPMPANNYQFPVMPMTSMGPNWSNQFGFGYGTAFGSQFGAYGGFGGFGAVPPGLFGMHAQQNGNGAVSQAPAPAHAATPPMLHPHR